MTSQQAPFPLQPLGVGETLDAGFRLWRRHFLIFFLLSIAAVAPGQLLSMWYFTANVLSVNDRGELLVSDPDAFLLGSMMITLIGALLQAIGWSALVNFGVNRYVGREMYAGEAVRGALRRLLPFIGLAIVYFLIFGIGLVFLVLPGIWLAVKFVLAFPAFFAEQIGPGRSLSRASSLVSGRWWRTFAVFLVAYILTSIVTSMAGALLVAIDLTSTNITSFYLLSAVVNTFLGALFTPLIPCMMIVAYFDARVRKEGYDIEYLSAQLAPPPPPPPPWEPDETGGGLIR